MNIQHISALNFGSYATLNLDLNRPHPTIISGPTGAGKSTIFDALTWGLFGKTVKDIRANEVISWSSDSTEVAIRLSTDSKEFTVVRVRGKVNDLYILENGQHVRGKDLKDTQEIIDTMLKMDFTTFVFSSYFHEFSEAASFFTSSAKDRRQLIEAIADVSYISNLICRINDGVKLLKDEITDSNVSTLEFMADSTKFNLDAAVTRAQSWHLTHNKTISRLQDKLNNYDAEKLKKKEEEHEATYFRLQQLDDSIHDLDILLESETATLAEHTKLTNILAEKPHTCKECGAPLDLDSRKVSERQLYKLDTKLKEIQTAKKQKITLENEKLQVGKILDRKLSQIEAETNPYIDELEREKAAECPWLADIQKLEAKHNDAYVKWHEAKDHIAVLQQNIESYKLTLEFLNQLKVAVFDQTTKALQDNVNSVLQTYFSSVLQINLKAVQDDMELTIINDGHECSFGQLSKGQRQLLRLSFAISVMEQVRDNTGARPNIMLFDELGDGLDDDTKCRLYNLFRRLSSESSIFVIDHSEAFKLLFDGKLTVTLNGGISSCEEA